MPYASGRSVLTRTVDWGILFHPICFGIRLRSLPNADVPSDQQHPKPSNCFILYDGSDIQPWHVPCIRLLPPIEFRHVYNVCGDVNVHELEGRTEDSTRNILLCSRWNSGVAIFYGFMCSVLARGDRIRISERQGCRD
jgi:hypothetical protein